MTPAPCCELLPAFLWQVVLHAAIVGFVFYAWAHRMALPSGRGKRRLLGVVIVLPLVTAAVPGRAGLDFRERVAWLDSGRILAIPLVGDIRVEHLVVLVLLLTVAATVWQELVPVLRRSRSGLDVPAALTELVRELVGWGRCEVVVRPSAGIELATGGWPWRPRLIVSQGALERLDEDELRAALRHEHAHWQAGRWLASHALFVGRLLQCHNPVALWAFREYCLEVEIECDAAAATARDRRVLIRTLLKIYESTERRDVASRSALRKRVDVLLADGVRDDALPLPTTVVAAAVLLAVLPWVV